MAGVAEVIAVALVAIALLAARASASAEMSYGNFCFHSISCSPLSSHILPSKVTFSGCSNAIHALKLTFAGPTARA